MARPIPSKEQCARACQWTHRWATGARWTWPAIAGLGLVALTLAAWLGAQGEVARAIAASLVGATVGAMGICALLPASRTEGMRMATQVEAGLMAFVKLADTPAGLAGLAVVQDVEARLATGRLRRWEAWRWSRALAWLPSFADMELARRAGAQSLGQVPAVAAALAARRKDRLEACLDPAPASPERGRL